MFETLPYFFEIITFLFVFAVVYGLLGMANILKSRRAEALVALVFGAVTASQAYAVSFFKGLLPAGAIILGILFFFGFIKKLFWKKEGGKKQGGENYLPLVVVLAVLLLLIAQTSSVLKPLFVRNIGLNNALIIIGLIIVILIFYAGWEKFKKGAEKQD